MTNSIASLRSNARLDNPSIVSTLDQKETSFLKASTSNSKWSVEMATVVYSSTGFCGARAHKSASDVS